MDINEMLKRGFELGAADIFLVGGLPVTYKVNGKMVKEGDKIMVPELEALIKSIYTMIDRPFLPREDRTEDDFSFSVSGMARFRCNVFYQRGSLSAVIRMLAFGIPSYMDRNIPETVMDIADYTKGLSIIAGPTGSGKSTTIACVIDKINHNYEKNIITMEDPIEFLFRHEKSVVIQREVPTDTPSFKTAIKSALRESPDVLFVGEMRDMDTMQSALTAAEAGRYVISTLHTMSAPDSIDRMIHSFPPDQQSQVRYQLSRVLRAVVCQHLVPGTDGNLYPVFEVMKVNTAIANLIREGKTFQIPTCIQTGRSQGMITMADSLNELASKGLISRKTVQSVLNEEQDAFLK